MDELDFITLLRKHPEKLRIPGGLLTHGGAENHVASLDTFRWGDPSHNIFNVAENPRQVIIRWKIKNKKTGKLVDGGERGRYDSVWISTAAHGSTVFWKHNPDYVTATGGKAYR